MLFSFSAVWNSPVKGTINPSNSGLRAWLFSRTDTFNANIIEGSFQINNVKPGSYILMIEGRPPYQNTSKDGIVVVDGQLTDVGIIELHK